MALDVLSGTPTSDINIIDQPQDELMFDYNALKKFYIQKSQLPPNSKVINEPDLFYELNQQVFWTIIISLILLSITLVLLVTNIIQRKSVEQKIKDQLSFLQILMDTIPIPIYFKNKDGTYENCNFSFENWFSISRAKIEGKRDEDLQGKGLVQLYQELDNSILEEAGVQSYEDSILSSNGEIHNVILHKATYKNAKGEIAGFVGVLFDITDRKKAEDNLRKAEEKYRSIFENSPLGIFRITPRGKLLDCNPALARMLGYEEPGALMRDSEAFPQALFADERQERELRKMLQQGSGIVQFERQFRRRDGQHLTLNINVRIIRHSLGTIKHFEGFAEDVTQKVNLERQLLQSQKMEAIGTLAGGIAHDFNNILTSIINSIELASMDIEEDSMAGNDLDRALKAAQRGSHLVKQILTFSRPSQDGFISTNLSHVLQEDLSLIKASLPRNIEIRENIQARQETTTADPTQIHQIVMNLCTNAFQALREQGGVLEVSLHEMPLGPDEANALHIAPGKYLCLAVSDNGPGIDTEILNKIFDPFFTTKGKGEGTGLGLAVVHGIAKNHNGAVRVSSTPWEETRFEILLPMQEEDDTLDQTPSMTSVQGAERVLFVEDDEDQIATIPRVLEQLGYTVQAESDATQALDAFRQAPEHFDVVITDFDMPEVNGLELAQQIRNLAPRTPVILVSGRETAVHALGRADNICKLVRKPYNRLSLSQAIREAMASRHNPTT
ncbi:MAG: PAS domain S-box protein [Desulfohalobium sp.]